MLFSSMIFIWVFLPIVLIINYIFNLLFSKDRKLRFTSKNIFLLIMSLLFYAWGGIYFLGIMLSSICINYLFGISIAHFKSERKIIRGILLFFDILINLLILIYYKYFNMIVVCIEQSLVNTTDKLAILNGIMNLQRTYELPFKDVVLPIGISFFTFQAMSYVIDVYREKVSAQKNIFNFGLYVALFPQLIAGPIVKYADVAKEISERNEKLEDFVYGIKRFCYGLAKKVLVANTLASVVDSIWALDLTNLGASLSWFAAFCYTLQIYYDFSGYSDMAIGLGRMLGFHFKENFDYPYMEGSITNYWRKWHMSLTSWFKDYVYIPLGGNRHGLFRTCLNIFIIFLLTGIWHGANFTYIIWGILYAIIEIFEKLWFTKVLDKNKYKFFNWLYMILVLTVLFVVFRANTINDALIYLSQLTSLKSEYSLFTYLSMKTIIAIVVAILCMGVLQKIFGNFYKAHKENILIRICDFLLQMALFISSISYIVSGTYNPFIYFQF